MPAPDLTARFAAGLARAGADPGAGLGLAVSGGSDSTALLHLAVQAGLRVRAVTVDHGLRPGSRDEAEAVAAACAALGVPHDRLDWQGWTGRGNLQQAAREARLRLIAGWAAAHGLGAVALGHTRDDQAETVLMRLARRAGVDGLSAMPPRRDHLGIAWLRPMLDLGRDELRAWLAARGTGWIDDPSNAQARFDRVRARAVLAALAPLGIGADTLAGVAAQMQTARAALDHQARAAAARLGRIVAGEVILDAALAAEPAEVQRRLIGAALAWVGGTPHPPRAEALARLIAAGQGTLNGCRLTRRGGALHLGREPRAAGPHQPPGTPWDHRWIVTGPFGPGMTVGALGPAGLARCPDWRAAGLRRGAALTSPAVWRGADLVAAPLVAPGGGWQAATLPPPRENLLSAIPH